jgi:hypothetical protein
MTGRHDRRFVPLVSAAFAEGQGRYSARSVQRRVSGCATRLSAISGASSVFIFVLNSFIPRNYSPD